MEWICTICGQKISSETRPIACPLCGVAEKYIIPEKEFRGFPSKLNAKSIQNLNVALSLENNAAKEYLEFGKVCLQLGDNDAADLFFALAKVEKGHQIAIKKMLSGIQKDL